MNATDILKRFSPHARLRYKNRWLVWDQELYSGDGGWWVYERKPYARKSKAIYKTDDDQVALTILTGGRA